MKQTITNTTGITISNDSTNKKMKNKFSTQNIKSIALLMALSICGMVSFAQSAGFNGAYLILSVNGGSDSYYDLNWSTDNPDFNHANLGTFVLGSNTLVLKGAEHNVWKCNGCDITATSMNYRIYSTSGSAGSFISSNVPWSSGSSNGCGGQDQQWKTTSSNINVLNGIGAGNYYLEVYEMATTTCGNQYVSNSGANYRAQFTVACPTVAIAAGSSTSICPGGSVTLSTTAISGATYQWKLSGSNVGSNSASYTVNQSGQFYLEVTTAEGCVVNSNTINITVNSNPTITVSASSLESTCGSTVTSTASGASTYSWSNGGTSATGSFTTAGTYTVTGTSAAGCTGTATVTVTNSSSTTSNAVTVHYYTEPTAVISGTTAVCQNASANITFTAANTNAGPYTFTYSINGGTSQTVVTAGSSLTATVAASTATEGTFTFALLSVADAHCSKSYSTGNTAIVTVNPTPTALVLTATNCAPANMGSIVSSTSQSSVTYQLSNADGDVGSPVSGTGTQLVWPNMADANAYRVTGTLGSCTSTSNFVNVANGTGGIAYYANLDGDAQYSNTPVYFCSGMQPAGYTTTAGTDCNDNNASIYLYATEICGNNIDENCTGASDDVPGFYRSNVATGDWGNASTWVVSCTADGLFLPAAYAPPSYYTGVVNIRNGHEVTIPANGTTYQTGTLDIDDGGTLTMTGNIAINNPSNTTANGGEIPNSIAKLTVTVNLNVDYTGVLNIGHQASMVETITASNSGSGNVNVQSKLTGTNNGTAPNGRYWYIGSPMNNTRADLTFFSTQDMVRLWRYKADNNSWAVVIHSTSNPTVTTDQKLIPGMGYLYRAGANKTITYTGTAGSNLNNNITSNLLAPTQDGTVVQVEGYSGSTGYKFVANPYPSYIDWKLVTRSGLNVSYWIRNASNTAYEAYNATTNTSTSPSGQTTQFIAPMQGFWVYAFNTTPSLRIDNTDRVHSTNVLHTPVISQVVRLKLNDGKSSDYAVVYENELASNDFEETDTDKMFDYDFHQLYTMEGEHELSLNGLLNATAKGSVDMGMVVPNNGPYTIEATDLGVEEEVILEDKFNHTFQDLKVNPIYSFTSNAGTFNNRFVLHFTNTETVGVGETVGETDGVSVYTTTGQQVKVWVTNTAEYQGATVKVYDAVGNMIERKNMTSNELLLDLNTATGVYMVEVTGDSKVFTKKVFIAK